MKALIKALGEAESAARIEVFGHSYKYIRRIVPNQLSTEPPVYQGSNDGKKWVKIPKPDLARFLNSFVGYKYNFNLKPSEQTETKSDSITFNHGNPIGKIIDTGDGSFRIQSATNPDDRVCNTKPKEKKRKK